MDTETTKPFMIASAVLLGLLGLAGSIFPDETIRHFGGTVEGGTAVVLQVAGALYLGFAVLNWMAREKAIGGIYSRPVAIGNFLHFLMIAILLLRQVVSGQTSAELIIATGAYVFFAVGFGSLVYGMGESCG